MTTSAEAGTVVVDVRTPDEYAAGHVDGAINVDVESADFGAQIAALPKDTQYAVYCRSGRRSTLATDQMSEAGFTFAGQPPGRNRGPAGCRRPDRDGLRRAEPRDRLNRPHGPPLLPRHTG